MNADIIKHCNMPTVCQQEAFLPKTESSVVTSQSVTVLMDLANGPLSDPRVAVIVCQLHSALETFKKCSIKFEEVAIDVQCFMIDKMCLTCWMPRLFKFLTSGESKALKCVSQDCRCDWS